MGKLVLGVEAYTRMDALVTVVVSLNGRSICTPLKITYK